MTRVSQLRRCGTIRFVASPTDKIRISMPRFRTIALAALVVVVTDVTWDGTSLHVSFGLPRRKPLVSLVFP